MKKTRKTLGQTAGGMALAIGLGCGTGTAGPRAAAQEATAASQPVAPAPLSPAEVDTSIRQSLDRLRSLEIVNVGRLVMNLPSEATACYGLPCPGGPWVAPTELERARQAPRLAKLAELAVAESRDAGLSPAPAGAAAAAVAALADLKIVEVAGLVLASPRYSGHCYGICPEDQAVADRENGLRAARVQAIAAAAKSAGL